MGLSNFTGNNTNNSNNTGNTPSAPPINMSLPPQIGGQIDIDEFVINYNKKFKNAGPTLFRDEIVEQTLAILDGKHKPNVLLIGAAGVGKTKIVEDIAYRIETKDPIIPQRLQNATVYELPISSLVAGAGIVGQLEERLSTIIDFMSDPKNNAILFIDEIHMICDDRSSTYDKIAQQLKPALARGDMRVIGATTLQESNKLATDPAFNRRFSRVIVDEFTREQTVEILKHLKTSFFNHYHHKLLIDDATLENVAAIADQFTSAGSHRPDNAITLLDRACGDTLMNFTKTKIDAQNRNDTAVLQALNSVPFISVSEKQIKETARSLMTGHAKKEDLDINLLTSNLSAIKGQDDVLAKIVELLKSYDKALYPRKQPLTMLFAGASGVGKTEITKIIAKTMTGLAPITLNMTEYHSSASINRIIGSPAGYVGSDSSTELPFDCLESNPYQIILLDEFEKCDRSVQRLFMSAFEEGYIKTSSGKIVDFSKAIIIATTNAANVDKTNTLGFTECKSSKRSDDTLISDLSRYFNIELLNRFTKIFEFNRLDKDIYRDIVASIYHRDITRIKSEHRKIKMPDYLDDDTLDELVEKSYIADFGARPAAKTVREYIENNV